MLMPEPRPVPGWPSGFWSSSRSAFDASGTISSLTFLYDGFSPLEGEQQGSYSVGSGYDASNNRITCTYPTGGPTLTNTFDAIERLSTIQDSLSTFATYDYIGRARMNTCQTGPTTQTFGWDGLRRLTDIDAGSVHDLAYGYDDFNRRTFKQYEHLLPTIQGDVYAYDGGSRLSDVWYDDANPTAGAPGTSLAHLNIQQTKVQARTSTTFNATTTLYSTGDPLHRTISIGGVPRTYDDKGNLTDNGAGRKFEYDAWNRMTRVLDGTGTELVRYEFDALGRRYKRFEGTTVTRYVYDGPRLLEEYVNPGTGVFALATRYIYGGGLDELIAIETGGLRYYTYRDALGSIEAITDSAGVVVERYDYDAFGVPTVTDGLGVPTPLGIYGEPTSQYGNDLWFTGARWDPESGNYHMRARQYEPLAGRFVSRDPLGYVDGPNAYSYGYSSPTNWTDPFGLEAGGSSGGNNPFLGVAMPTSFTPEDAHTLSPTAARQETEKERRNREFLVKWAKADRKAAEEVHKTAADYGTVAAVTGGELFARVHDMEEMAVAGIVDGYQPQYLSNLAHNSRARIEGGESSNAVALDSFVDTSTDVALEFGMYYAGGYLLRGIGLGVGKIARPLLSRAKSCWSGLRSGGVSQVRSSGAVHTLADDGRKLIVSENHLNHLRSAFGRSNGRLNLFNPSFWKHVLPHRHIYRLPNAPGNLNANWRKTFEKLNAIKQTLWPWQ